MFTDFEKIQVNVRPGQTDIRKAINGLSIIAQQKMGLRLLRPSSFLYLVRVQAVGQVSGQGNGSELYLSDSRGA